MSDQVTQQPPQVADDEIDLRELFSAIWQGKWIIIATTFVFAVSSVIYALSLPNIYKSEALLAPVNADSGMQLPGQLGGLAALAGVNLGTRGVDKSTLALEVLKSREFIGQIIEKHNLYVEILAAEGWTPENNSLVINNKKYDVKTQQWIQNKEPQALYKPSIQKAYTKFMNQFSVSQDKTTGMVRVSVSHYSPTVAKNMVDTIVKEINENMQNRDSAEAQSSINYLNEQISKTNLADARSMFFSLIEEQTKNLMLANVRNEYVFKTIDSAVIAEKKSKPARALICIVGFIFGLILGTLIVIIRKRS